MKKMTLARVLVCSGLVATLAGSVDPVEGSLLVLPGLGLAALGAWISGGPFVRSLAWLFASTLVGVGLLWYISSLGGVGGDHGLNPWWGLLLLPYPIGWLGGLALAILWLRERGWRRGPAA